MELKFITCSGTNETTSVPELLQLLNEFPRAEIGVQVSNKKATFGTPRYDWIHSLWKQVRHRKRVINAALHVNLQWVEDFGQGIVAPELNEFLLLTYDDGTPFFQRVQLNFKVGREKTPDVDKLEKNICLYPRQRFILSYNQSNKALIRQLYLRGIKFDCLYDESFGTGIVPEKRVGPAYLDLLQGYAGGITPENVQEELDKIAKANEKFWGIKGVYIDAHKGLEDEQTHFDLGKCRAYLNNAESWYKNYLIDK